MTGDATGGTMNVQVNLRSTTGLPIGNAWSLERISALDTELTPKTLLLFAANLQVQVSGMPFQWLVNLVRAQLTTSTILDASGQGGLPIFLGLAQNALSASAITFGLLNANTETLSITAKGYIWTPRSVLQAPGGYRRPVDGMFGAQG